MRVAPEMERQLARPVMRSGLGAEALSRIGWASDARGTEVASKVAKTFAPTPCKPTSMVDRFGSRSLVTARR